jgi:hypothetical protein
MSKRKIFLIIAAFILTSIITSLGTVAVLAAWPFDDVLPGDWFYNDVHWMDSNGITHGCDATHYCPDDYVTRAEMAAFLHRMAGVQVAAGAHYKRDAADTLYVDKWFNNVNGVAPTIVGGGTFYDINVGFATTDRFVMCAVDTAKADTRDALCTVSTPGGNTVRVRIYDASVGGFAPAEFWVMVYGQ